MPPESKRSSLRAQNTNSFPFCQLDISQLFFIFGEISIWIYQGVRKKRKHWSFFHFILIISPHESVEKPTNEVGKSNLKKTQGLIPMGTVR